MFKKFLAFIMITSIFTVQAQASSQNGLKAAFDELNYSLTVDWDQKDQGFHDAQVEKFEGAIGQLREEGLSNGDMISFLKSQVKDARFASDINSAYSMTSNNEMSSDEATTFVMDSMKRSYSNGASWYMNAENGVFIACGILVAVVLLSNATSTPTPR